MGAHLGDLTLLLLELHLSLPPPQLEVEAVLTSTIAQMTTNQVLRENEVELLSDETRNLLSQEFPFKMSPTGQNGRIPDNSHNDCRG